MTTEYGNHLTTVQELKQGRNWVQGKMKLWMYVTQNNVRK